MFTKSLGVHQIDRTIVILIIVVMVVLGLCVVELRGLGSVNLAHIASWALIKALEVAG